MSDVIQFVLPQKAYPFMKPLPIHSKYIVSFWACTFKVCIKPIHFEAIQNEINRLKYTTIDSQV